MAEQNGVRNGIMAPFANRVADGRYSFGGRELDLMPGVTGERIIYHGMVRTLPWAVVSHEQTDDGERLVLSCSIRPDLNQGYPFTVDVEVTYQLRAGSLDVDITSFNVGDAAAPFATGWHPYFRLPGAAQVDSLELDVPGKVRVMTDDRLIPLSGEAAYESVPNGRTTWEPLGDTVLDVAYSQLQTDDDGLARTVLRDPASGASLTIWQERGLMHVFTGDTLARDQRVSIALEPVEIMTNAFNRPDCAAALRLEPGTSRTFRFGVVVDPGT